MAAVTAAPVLKESETARAKEFHTRYLNDTIATLVEVTSDFATKLLETTRPALNKEGTKLGPYQLKGIIGKNNYTFIATYYPEKTEDPTQNQVLQLETFDPSTQKFQVTRQQTGGMTANINRIFNAFAKSL